MGTLKFVIIVCTIIALAILIPPLIVTVAWNFYVAPFFKLPEITYAASLGLWFILGVIASLFKGGTNAENR